MNRRRMLAFAAASAAAPRAFAQDLAITSPKGIDEGRFLTAGGVEQWVRIRGEDRDNPIVLYVHGGPGAGMSSSGWAFFTRLGWEKPFTFVTWDQQGAGKTWVRAGKKIDPGLTMDRIAADGIEIADQVRRRLGKRKVILLGGSWGSHISVRMVKRRPDLFHAYVGTGQTVKTEIGEALAYQRVLAKARALGDEVAVKALTDAGPPPYASIEEFVVQRRYANAYERPAGSVAPPAPGATAQDMTDFREAFIATDTFFRGADMQGPIKDIDLYAMGRDFQVPVFIFQGEDDYITPTAPVEQWFRWIRAPRKEIVLIPGAGHNILFRGPQLLDLTVRKVRPLAA